ncbi:uncharacterized protein LOC143905614 [Temnothorax americanus]|uniref:uncharacterized protein LOC143905614 n=1 Tax=Temnothorax americanus TaxID=1964332 RepID=UPI004067605E
MRLVAAPTPTIPGLLSLPLAWLRGTWDHNCGGSTQSRLMHAITCTTPHRNNRFNFSIAFHQWMFMQSRAAPSSLIEEQKIYLLDIVTLLSISGSSRRAAPSSLISIKLF